jgi:uncharacterized protein
VNPPINAADRRRRSRGKRWRDRAECGCDCIDCGSGCTFLVIGPLLGRLALTTPNRMPRAQISVPARTGMVLIRGYRRWLTQCLPTACRQLPTCSAYGLEAVRRYGLWTGVRLTAGRLHRCTPATARGTVDPVP